MLFQYEAEEKAKPKYFVFKFQDLVQHMILQDTVSNWLEHSIRYKEQIHKTHSSTVP